MENNQLIEIVKNANKADIQDNPFTKEIAQKVISFHKTLAEYIPTPLVSLTNVASDLGVNSIYVKDESKRFNLNAFKVLGGSYCLSKVGKNKSDTFITATDGNHGRGIAYSCKSLGFNCIVLLPKGTDSERLKNIQSLGANAKITDLNYDDTVRLAEKIAKENGYILVQDTTLPDYEKIPTYIMQGYLTMALEALEQIKDKPTHIFLQAGVGSMAGALTAFFYDVYKGDMPVISIVEASKANCIYKTIKANDGTIHKVTGDLDTIMAGLACGEPCSLGLKYISAKADFIISANDEITKNAMKLLHKNNIISGESGAVTTGVVEYICKDNNLRDMFNITKDSNILVFSTEGNTSQKSYNKIVFGKE